ncbi:flavin reductase family protein [Enterococcus sp. AZ109]|uniref:flavin reductase family protein n=1 Tax=Enterococcus sp. AZ109 TaxID=2774634 RepID=UPI003F289956
MNYDFGKERPEHFVGSYPEQFDLFSHFELLTTIPQVLFALTTWKENGQPNVCLHGWSSFYNDDPSYHAAICGLFKHTHTYQNILREGVFAVNFFSKDHYAALEQTILHNELEQDEFAVGNFTQAPAKVISAPVIKESLLVLECKVADAAKIIEGDLTATTLAEVVQGTFSKSYMEGQQDLMYLMPGKQDLKTGKPTPSSIGHIEIDFSE